MKDLVLVLIVVGVTIGFLYKISPQIKGIIIKLLKFDLGEPYTGSCAQKCSEIEDVGHDLGEITLTESGDICGHDDLENAGRDFFKFTVAESGEITVTFQPEYWLEEGFYFCYEPTLTIYSGECGSLRHEGMHSALFGQCPGSYFIFTGDPTAVVEFYAKKGVTYYAELNGRFDGVDPADGYKEVDPTITVSLLTCEQCIGLGKEWCEHPTKEGGRCFPKCTKGFGIVNCPGIGFCIKDRDDCTPSVCEGKSEAECTADHWCKFCPLCENKKRNVEGKATCIPYNENCEYECVKGECDSCVDGTCDSGEKCDSVTCECEYTYCCDITDTTTFQVESKCMTESECKKEGEKPGKFTTFTHTPCNSDTDCSEDEY